MSMFISFAFIVGVSFLDQRGTVRADSGMIIVFVVSMLRAKKSGCSVLLLYDVSLQYQLELVFT